MAADNDNEKTEDPTPHRRSQAREKGNVARSTDLNAAIVMLAAAGGLTMFGLLIADGIAKLLEFFLVAPLGTELNGDQIINLFWRIAEHLMMHVLPFSLFMAIAAVSANLLQVGVLFTSEPLAPKLNRLNPLEGFKRIFSMQSLVKFGISIGKISILATIATMFLMGEVPKFAALHGLEIAFVLGYISDRTVMLAYMLAAALIILAILDFSFQKWKHEQQLKMSKQEIRDEMKNMEGDPLIRQRRREAHAKLAQARELGAVPDADVVITNPTHISVALKYDPSKHPAPVVVAKGVGEIALRIREIAREHNVPIIERKPLARALHRDIKVGQPIPTEMYATFVEIMAYVYKLSGKRLPNM